MTRARATNSKKKLSPVRLPLKKNPPTKTAAVCTIKDMGSMTEAGRDAIALWLREIANELQFDPMAYASHQTTRFTYRYHPTSKKRARA